MDGTIADDCKLLPACCEVFDVLGDLQPVLQETSNAPEHTAK